MTDREKVSAIAAKMVKFRNGAFPFDDGEDFDNAMHLIDDIETVVTS